VDQCLGLFEGGEVVEEDWRACGGRRCHERAVGVLSKAQSAGFGATPQRMHLALTGPSLRRKRHESAMSIVMGLVWLTNIVALPCIGHLAHPFWKEAR
jgi:hypothetical protein